MEAIWLKMLGATALFGAVLVGSYDRHAGERRELADCGNPSRPAPGQGGGDSEPAAGRLRQRTLTSRQTDLSIASRLRREGPVHVGGQVARPGPVPCPPGLTLWQVIQAAGGPTPFGSLRRVKLYRAGKLLTYDLSSTEGSKIVVMPDDAVEVPQKMIFGR